MKYYKSPKNAQEYWEVVFDYWDDLYHILRVYLPTFKHEWIDSSPLDMSLSDYLVVLRDAQDSKLIRALNAAMWNCPEDRSGEWAHKNWNVLYDLCLSECYIREPLEE